MSKSTKPPCTEWVENWGGTPVEVDSHEYEEYLNNGKIQTLRCKKCGKHSTGIIKNNPKY